MTQFDGNESARASARAKLGADETASAKIELATRSLRLLHAAGAVIVAIFGAVVWIAVGVNNLKRDLVDLAKDVGKNTAFIEAQKGVNAAHQLILEANRRDLDDRKPLIKEIDEMWFMKEHGISNKEDFMAKHGYPAPSNPDANTPPRK